jgi:acetyl esterase/lipase
MRLRKALKCVSIIYVITCLVAQSPATSAADRKRGARRAKELPEAVNAAGVAATHANVRYGPHKRNLFDIWLAKADRPTPLVIYIHGGGFTGGDKSKIYKSEDMPRFLNAGVSFATINYRYRTGEPRGVRGCLSDSKRALQFIRSRANEWNIDKKRIGAYGGSAGSGTATWLAFHDDMAEPDNPDPVLRESTRLAVVGALATQATYDVLQWPELLGYTPDPQVYAAAIREATAFYGIESVEQLEGPEGAAIRADLDMLGLMSRDDPPLYVSNPMKGGTPDTRGHRNHHPLHAVALKKRAEEVGVEAEVHAEKIGVKPAKSEGLVNFFLRHLGVK